MSKLWQKGYELDTLIERFTVGNDVTLDKELISFDCYASIAHAAMLVKLGILSPHEWKLLVTELRKYAQSPSSLSLALQDEDVHTALENALCVAVGQAGKKIHAARSRNDQVLVDLRLFAREKLLSLMQNLITCLAIIHDFAQKHADTPLVGRTHFQKAMPSSVGLWMGALTESLLDDFELLKGAYMIINQCPLGSAASYGTALAVDRQMVSDLLGFDKVQNNVLYANNSRGKFESIMLHALVQIMTDLSKYATDIILFSTPEFGYFSLPESLCSGSSLMPQKRNPCMLELIRAKTSTVLSCLTQVLDIIKALPSGYNRDFQETKSPFMIGITITHDSLEVFARVINQMKVHPEACAQAFTPEVFATDAALQLLKQGVPFREAYKKIAQDLISGTFNESSDLAALLTTRTHMGAPGNLGLEIAARRIEQAREFLHEKSAQHEAVCKKLNTMNLEEFL